MKKKETLKHILVIEDEPEHAELIGRGFERDNGHYRVTVVSTIADARSSIIEHVPDLALVDYRLPDGQGDEVITLAAGLFPVVLMTSHGDEHLAVQAIKAGALDYIVKSPATFNEISFVAEQALLEWAFSLERKTAEEKLQKSDERLRTVLNTAMDGFWLLDNLGFLQDVNEKYCEMSGFSKRDLLSMTIFDLEAFEESNETIAHMDLIIKKGEHRFETQHRRKDGTIFDVEISVQFRADFDDNFVCFLRDISNQKKLTTLLRQSQVRYQTLIEKAIDGIVYLSVDYKILMVNKSFARMHGYSVNEMEKMTLKDLDTPASVQQLPSIMSKIIAGETVEFEVEHYHRNGHTFPLQVSANLVTINDETFVQAFHRDITERKKLESQLYESERFARSVVDSLTMKIAILDETGIIIGVNSRWNNAALRYLPTVESVGKGVNYLQVCDAATGADALNAKGIAAGIRSVLHGKQSKFSSEYPCDTPDEKRWFNVSVSRFVGSGPVRVVVAHEEITARKLLEIALNESNDKFKTLFDSSTDAIMLLTENGFVDCNPHSLKVFGLSTKDELINYHPSELSPPLQPNGTDSKTAAAEHIAAALEKGSNRFEWVHRRFGGEDFPAEVLLSAFEYHGERVLQATVRDITARRKAEEALQNEHLLLRTLIENIPDAVYTKDLDFRKTLCNQVDVQFTGAKSPSELIGRDDFAFYPREVAEKFLADDQSVISTGVPLLNREEYIFDGNGEKRWLLSSKTPLRDKNNQIIGLVGISHDITARKQAEGKIRRLSQAVEQSSASIMITDTAGLLEYVNPKFVELTGYKADEVIGKNPRFLKSGYTSAEEYRRLWNNITSGKEWNGEFHNRKKNGELYWEFATISAIVDEHGTITNFIAVKEDITERKKAEEERELLIMELKGALEQIKTLKGIVPICASCKQIRDDEGFWQQVELYVEKHTEAQFSHGICPDCVEKLYPQYGKNKPIK
jgi:PAS domain S-box-containing protein